VDDFAEVTLALVGYLEGGTLHREHRRSLRRRDIVLLPLDDTAELFISLVVARVSRLALLHNIPAMLPDA